MPKNDENHGCIAFYGEPFIVLTVIFLAAELSSMVCISGNKNFLLTKVIPKNNENHGCITFWGVSLKLFLEQLHSWS
jgi:hypothetical protein